MNDNATLLKQMEEAWEAVTRSSSCAPFYVMIKGIAMRADKPGLVSTDDRTWREPTEAERETLRPWINAGLRL